MDLGWLLIHGAVNLIILHRTQLCWTFVQGWRGCRGLLVASLSLPLFSNFFRSQIVHILSWLNSAYKSILRDVGRLGRHCLLNIICRRLRINLLYTSLYRTIRFMMKLTLGWSWLIDVGPRRGTLSIITKIWLALGPRLLKIICIYSFIVFGRTSSHFQIWINNYSS